MVSAAKGADDPSLSTPMTTFHFEAIYRPQFGGPSRSAGRVSVEAESQNHALAVIHAAASPTAKSMTVWLPAHGCPSIHGGW